MTWLYWLPFSRPSKQPFGLFLDGENVGADLFERAQRLRLVEVPREADLVADLGGVFLDPGIGRVGQHLAADEGLDAAVFQQRNLLGVAQIGVGLVFDDDMSCRRLSTRNRPCSGSASALPGLWTLAMTRRRGLDAPAHCLEDLLQVGGGELDVWLLERGVHAVAEDVVVLEERRRPVPRAASWRLRPGGRRAPKSWGRAASFSSSRASPSSCCRPPLHLPLLRRCPSRPDASPAPRTLCRSSAKRSSPNSS